jgi:DNA-binding NtrC family response regulator
MHFYRDFLFVTSSNGAREKLSKVCRDKSWQADFASDFEKALERFDAEKFKVILIDIDAAGRGAAGLGVAGSDDAGSCGLQLLEWIASRNVFTKLGVITAETAKPAVVTALKIGATVVLSAEILSDEGRLARFLGETLEDFAADWDIKVHSQYCAALKHNVDWVGDDHSVRALVDAAKIQARSNQAVLICGAVGSGLKQLAKVVLAETKVEQLLWFDAGEIPEHEQKLKFFVDVQSLSADSPVVFCVTEIAQLKSDLQDVLSACLRGEGLSGASDKIWPKLKLIATTSVDLELAVRAGKFRADLYWFLEKNKLAVLPLSQRKSDIPTLAGYFLENEFAKNRVCYFSDDAMIALRAYDWPENIAELKKTVKDIAEKNRDVTIKAKDLPAKILEKSFYVPGRDTGETAGLTYNDAKRAVLEKFNREYIAEVLSRANHNLTVAAERAGMDRSNFKKIIKKYFPDD